MSESQVTTAVAQSKKLKPARKQVKPGQVEKKEAEQTGKEYNIWYNKWAGGDREDSYSNKVKSQTRCNIKKDSGFTRADASGVKYCCLFFARGCCPYGYECNYLHRLPVAGSELPDTSKDCFAREKFSDYRDDMGGVGSFSRQNRTLYVGRVRETGNAAETEMVARRHFGEFGKIIHVRILQHRSVAFITYEDELQAQFAKEAMACQSMDNDEILNVRWATEDPNPTSKVAEKRRLEEIGTAAIQAKLDPRIIDAVRSIRALEDGDVLEDEDTFGPEDDDDQDQFDAQDEPDGDGSRKRRRIDNGESQSRSPSPPVQASGLLTADTMQGLKYFAQLRAARGGGAPVLVSKTAPTAPVQAPALGGLGDYGSDDED